LQAISGRLAPVSKRLPRRFRPRAIRPEPATGLWVGPSRGKPVAT